MAASDFDDAKIVALEVPPKGQRLRLCGACRAAMHDDPSTVRYLGAVIVIGGVGHLDVGTHPYVVRTACGQVLTRDELGEHSSPSC